MYLDFSQIKRINSVGIRDLKVCLNRLRIESAEIVFVGVTPPIMEARDFVSNLFPENSKIESVYLPYVCSACQLSFLNLVPAGELKGHQEDLMRSPCIRCGHTSEFDHVAELYFGDL
jgi:hypothetical protein